MVRNGFRRPSTVLTNIPGCTKVCCQVLQSIAQNQTALVRPGSDRCIPGLWDQGGFIRTSVLLSGISSLNGGASSSGSPLWCITPFPAPVAFQLGLALFESPEKASAGLIPFTRAIYVSKKLAYGPWVTLPFELSTSC